jgi:hypothetical protein
MRIIVQLIFKEWVVRTWTEIVWLKTGQLWAVFDGVVKRGVVC